MSSSELSDALNPYASSRQRQNIQEFSPQVQHAVYRPIVQPPQQFVPHVSELQMAMSHPPPQAPPARPSQGAQVVSQILGMIHATQKAHEEERQRRLAWEKEQETRNAEKQTQMENKMHELFDELKALRSSMNAMAAPPSTSTPNLAVVTSQNAASPLLSRPAVMSPAFHPVTPTSPVPQTVQSARTRSSQTNLTFIQGSSNGASSASASPVHTPERASLAQPSPRIVTSPTFRVSLAPPSGTITPDPSPLLANTEISDQASTSQSSRVSKRKKKHKPAVSSDDDGSSSSTSSSVDERPRKRKNGHDNRIYTVHHAMRQHLLRMMVLENDKDLPDSFPENSHIGPHDPVRFVWDKTTKQSVHNGRMKKRVMDDIKENRRLYKHVSSKDWGKKQVDAAFEQCFVTLRQKYKVQRGATSALNFKQREDNKARKARHISRRKLKLSSRSEARNKLPEYEHVVFDGALQHDCMSSEESDVELDPQTSQNVPILRTRGYSWRSSRLLNFYDVLDEEERAESNTRPQRGSGKRGRRIGEPKDEFVLPPEGVSTWMISKRWLRASLGTHPDLESSLSKLIVDPPGFDWMNFHELGEDSSEEDVVDQDDFVQGQTQILTQAQDQSQIIHQQIQQHQQQQLHLQQHIQHHHQQQHQVFQHAPPPHPPPPNLYGVGMHHMNMDMGIPQHHYTTTNGGFMNYSM